MGLESADPLSPLACGICKHMLCDARFLPCFHTFCTACLQLLSDKIVSSPESVKQMHCPTCNQLFTLPTTGVIGLTLNTMANQLVLAAVGSERSTSQDQDHPSKRARALRSVPQSNSNTLTQSHSDSHAEAKSDIVTSDAAQAKSLDDSRDQTIMSEASQSSLAPTSADRCQEHESPMRYVCATCDILVCGDCAVEKHQSHRVIRISKAIQEERIILKQQLAVGQDTLTKLAVSSFPRFMMYRWEKKGFASLMFVFVALAIIYFRNVAHYHKPIEKTIFLLFFSFSLSHIYQVESLIQSSFYVHSCANTHDYD
eukprot:TRINITY_DN2479_c0_g1_i5.p1 TRINITY_DN2479_c0_g1~~TRINITY_DN2479_c0_g1_i5.p1  ORF type:complete len:313 (-),score=50.93 TRINITY_DN2479_c0_g1_i5:2417-3355(-)